MSKGSKIAGVVIALLIFCSAERCRAGAGIEEEMAEADDYAQAGQYAQAESAYKLITSKNLGTTIGLESQRKLIVLYVEQDKQEQVEGALQVLVNSFSQNQYTTWEVFGIGEQYRKANEYQKAIPFYQCILNNWPSTDCAIWAATHIAVMDIARGNDAGVEAAFQKIVTDFAGNQEAAAVVYKIAEDYRMGGKNEKALPYYKYVADNWPEKDFAVYCQMYVVTLNFEMGNDEAAKLALKKLLMDYSTSDKLATAVWEVSHCCRKMNKYDKMDAFYQYALDTAGQGEFTLWPMVGKAITKIGIGDYNSVDVIVNHIAANYSQHPYITNALTLIAEECYIEGLESEGKGHDEQARKQMEKAAAILERVINNFPKSENAVYINYMLGLSLYEQEDYINAVVAFMNAIEIDYNQTDGGNIQWCWLRVADCFEKLKVEGGVDANEMDIMIEDAYQNVVIRCANGSNFERALLRLGEINIEKHKYATGCMYFQQFLTNADSNDPRIAEINGIVENFRSAADE